MSTAKPTVMLAVQPLYVARQEAYNAHTYDAERKQWLSKLSDYLEILTA